MEILDPIVLSSTGIGIVGTLVVVYGAPKVVKGLQGIVKFCNKLIKKLTGKK